MSTTNSCDCGCDEKADCTCGCCGMSLSSGCDCPDDADYDHQLTWAENAKLYTYNQVRDMIDVKTKSLEEELANYRKFEYQIENHEYEYCNYGTQWRRGDDVCYRVAGGGMMNGNAYAEVERSDYIWYYCEYGKNPSRSVIGTKIVWSNEIYRGDDPYECRNFDILP